jgi:putative acetyltransferase
MSFEIRIRPALPGESAAFVGIIEAVFREYGFVFEARDEVPDILDLDRVYDGISAAFFAAEAGGSPVATIGVKLRGEAAEILRLYVLPAWRRRGLARRLCDEAIAWARGRGARRIELWSDTRFTAAHELYRGMGFTQEGRRSLDDANRSEEFRFYRDEG